MNKQDLAKEVSEFITANLPDGELDLEESALSVSDFIEELEAGDDDAEGEDPAA